MRRLLFAIAMACTATVANSQNMYLAQSPGGVGMTSAGMMKEFLDKRGYNIDLKSLGSCALAKQAWENTTDKFITVWENGFDSVKNAPCNLSTKPEQFVKVYFQSYLYFCSVPGKDPNLWTTKNATYTVGSGLGIPTAALMQSIDSKTGAKASPVIYKNSGAVATAIAAREVDYVLASGGTNKIIEEGGKCFWTTAPDSLAVNGIPNIKKQFPDNVFSDVGVTMWLIAKNFSDAEIKKLRTDINEFLVTDTWKKYLATREVANVVDVPEAEAKRQLNHNIMILDKF